MQYLMHVVKTIRGREASTVAKLQNQGWEFVSQNQGQASHGADFPPCEA